MMKGFAKAILLGLAQGGISGAALLFLKETDVQSPLYNVVFSGLTVFLIVSSALYGRFLK